MTPSAPNRSPRRRLIEAVVIFVSCVFAAFAVDVAVHLTTFERLVLGHQSQGSARDYAYLLGAETQVALFVIAISFALALALARVLRGTDASGHAIILSAAFFSGAVMLADRHIVWNKTPGHDPLAFSAVGYLLALAVMVAVWVVLYLMARREAGSSWRAERVFVSVLFPPLLVGLVNLALSERGSAETARVNFTAAAVVVVLMLVVLWFRSRIVRLAVAVLAVLGVVWLVVAAVTNNAAFGVTTDHTKRRPGPRLPNIVLIVLDTVRADHLDLSGYERDTLPALRSWADGATVFDRAVAAAGWTAPSHASMLSGVPVSLHGIHYSAGGAFQTPAKNNVIWLPEKLSRKGYYCLAVSSNPLALSKAISGFKRALIPRRHPWYTSTMASLTDHYSPLLQRINERGRWRLPYMVAADIVETTERAVPEGDGPVFLFVNFLDAHSPFDPPASALKALALNPPHIFSRYHNHRELTIGWDHLPDEKREVVTDLYDAEIRGMNAPLQRMLQWIDDRFGKDTVVIVTSDHGEELGEDGRIGHEYGLGQSIVHVPLVIRSPWFTAERRSELVTTRSLDRFIDAVARGEKPKVESLSRSDKFGIISERYASAYNIEHLGQDYNRSWISLIEGDYKAIGPSVNGFELFDINSHGFDNEAIVFDTAPGEHLRSQIDRFWESSFDRREKNIKFEPTSEEELKRLRALGYIK